MQIHPTNWNIHFLASDLRNSTSSVRFHRLSFNPTKEKRQWRLTIAVRFFWSGRRESRVRIANAQPLGASAFGRIPKNSPLDCFSTEFHLIGSIPSLKFQPEKRKTAMAINHCRTFFFGAGDGNRTRVTSLGSLGNNHYTTPAFQRKKYTACDPGFDKNPPCFQ